MKYIDAEKLIAEIERLPSSDHLIEYEPVEKLAYNRALVEIEDAITSLQQEQPEVDLAQYVNERVAEIFPEQDNDFLSEEDLRKVIRNTARHFYELGLNARKEDEK